MMLLTTTNQVGEYNIVSWLANSPLSCPQSQVVTDHKSQATIHDLYMILVYSVLYYIFHFAIFKGAKCLYLVYYCLEVEADIFEASVEKIVQEKR